MAARATEADSVAPFGLLSRIANGRAQLQGRTAEPGAPATHTTLTRARAGRVGARGSRSGQEGRASLETQRRQWLPHPIGVFRLRRPSTADVHATLNACADSPFTYREVGATSTTPPSGYAVDRYGVDLGRGRPTFERGRLAIESFAMYSPAWTSIVRRGSGPLTPNLVFASIIRHFGFWSINPGRLIYVLDGDNRAGFGFGTLPGHTERRIKSSRQWRPGISTGCFKSWIALSLKRRAKRLALHGGGAGRGTAGPRRCLALSGRTRHRLPCWGREFLGLTALVKCHLPMGVTRPKM